jgi:hypothetical protein
VDNALLEKGSFQHYSQDGAEQLHSLKGKLQGAWQTEIQVQLHCVHNRELGGGVAGAEGQCCSG